ncbi:MAG: LysE family transporter [Cyclobacteriaceae bacterium]|nr:LysE family transporter [Cyclobacteriaceae bacterium]UYN86300.1 MAG: LysE family transporter [Cyclobacteriaceae bacterium]
MIVQVFIVGAVFSFLGSIPPGTLNLLVLQMGLEHRIKAALRFALAVAIVEYPYAWIAVEFEQLITSSPVVMQNFQLWGAIIMTVIGIASLWSVRKPTAISVKLQESGFRRGIILSILNPQAIPFWIALTAYLKYQGWIDISTGWRLHSYVLGTSVGAFALLSLLIFLAHRIASSFRDNRLLRMIPGLVLLGLGIIGFVRYFFF